MANHAERTQIRKRKGAYRGFKEVINPAMLTISPIDHLYTPDLRVSELSRVSFKIQPNKHKQGKTTYIVLTSGLISSCLYFSLVLFHCISLNSLATLSFRQCCCYKIRVSRPDHLHCPIQLASCKPNHLLSLISQTSQCMSPISESAPTCITNQLIHAYRFMPII